MERAKFYLTTEIDENYKIRHYSDALNTQKTVFIDKTLSKGKQSDVIPRYLIELVEMLRKTTPQHCDFDSCQ